MRHFPAIITAALAALAMNGIAPHAHAQTVTTFDNGAEGWEGPQGIGGGTTIEPDGGNTGAYMRTEFNDFGITFRNSTNPAFIGDFTNATEVTLSVDVRVEFLDFFGQTVSRPWLVELRNFDLAQGGYPWVSVWYLFDDISQANNAEWTNYAVGFDPSATDLPPGWGGTGDEDPNTFEPTLPADVTFAQVLAGVDEIAFTTLQPGLFFGFTDHTIGIDNVGVIRRVPCPADYNEDGDVNIYDVLNFLMDWNAGGPDADYNGDGNVNVVDVVDFITVWNNGCP